MEGITSHETQLTVLSAVDNVKAELEKIEEENRPDENTVVDRMMFGNSSTKNNSDENPSGDE